MTRTKPHRNDLDLDDEEEVTIVEVPPTPEEKYEEVKKKRDIQLLCIDLLDHPMKAQDYRGLSIEQAVSRCAEAYSAAMVQAIHEAGYELKPEEVKEYASAVWRCSMPDLLDKHSARQYVACVAWGLKMSLIDANTAKSMMYIAQLLLSVLRIEVAREEPERAPRALESAPLFTEGQLLAAPQKDVG